MKTIFFTISLFLCCASLSSGQSEKQITFLFDNSGSMSGYYRERSSSFLTFATSLIKNSINNNDDISIMLFSKTELKRGIKSPVTIFSGKAKDLIPDVLSKQFQLTKGIDGQLGNTDLIEALDSGLQRFGNKQGVIWMLTDNINDVSGTGDSSYYNTLLFYSRLKNDTNFRKILMFPIPEKVLEGGYNSYGYVLYGMVYSKSSLSQIELEKFHFYLTNVGIKSKPITLKPLDVASFVIKPRQLPKQIIPHKLYFDGRAIRGVDFEEGEVIKERFDDLILKSNLFPYYLKKANLRIRLENLASSDYSVINSGTQIIFPTSVTMIKPEGEVAGVTLIFSMPEIKPKFSLNTILRDYFTVSGNFVLEITDAEVVLDEAYMNSLTQLFALKSVPEIFYPHLKDNKIISIIPFEIQIKYGVWRIILLISILLILVVAVTLIVYIVFRKRKFTILINNNIMETVYLSILGSFPIFGENVGLLARLKKSLFNTIYLIHSANTSTPYRKIMLREGIPEIIEYDNYNQTKRVSIELKKEKVDDSSTGSLSNPEFY
ncbi:MAG: hypothetical protein ACP5P3_03345 [Ignavibacteria bacterium]